jgi:hypothetical protein
VVPRVHADRLHMWVSTDSRRAPEHKHAVRLQRVRAHLCTRTLTHAAAVDMRLVAGAVLQESRLQDTQERQGSVDCAGWHRCWNQADAPLPVRLC